MIRMRHSEVCQPRFDRHKILDMVYKHQLSPILRRRKLLQLSLRESHIQTSILTNCSIAASTSHFRALKKRNRSGSDQICSGFNFVFISASFCHKTLQREAGQNSCTYGFLFCVQMAKPPDSRQSKWNSPCHIVETRCVLHARGLIDLFFCFLLVFLTVISYSWFLDSLSKFKPFLIAREWFDVDSSASLLTRKFKIDQNWSKFTVKRLKLEVTCVSTWENFPEEGGRNSS